MIPLAERKEIIADYDNFMYYTREQVAEMQPLVANL